MNRSAIFACAALTLTTIGVTVGPGVAQESSGVAQPPTLDFSTLLEEAGVADEQFAPFAAWNGATNDAEASTLAQILFRLAQFDRTATLSGGDGIGDLAAIEGVVHSVKQLELPESAPAELRESGLFVCELKQADGKLATILSARVPSAWLQRANSATLAEPASLRGVRLGSIERNGAAKPLLLTNHIAWQPAAGVAAGTAWLAAQGFDAALLDDVRQNRAFAKPNESTEAQAFYTALAAIAAGDAAELRKLAREAVAAEATRREAIAASAAERQRELNKELESVLPQRRAEIEKELAELRRSQTMAAYVQKRAAIGLSSVGPMFNEPADSVGKFFVIEGIARRAVRIVVDDPSRATAAGAAAPLTHYYELDVFPTDAQNNPVICCVARLPEGFPTGDLIREPVRVSGIFFKKWAYARRPDQGAADSAAPARVAPPLMLAAEPQWLPASAPVQGDRGLWAGIGILAASVVVAIILFRTARRDRLARRQSARYDGPLDDLLEPK
jgi:hypothetical protein